MSIENLSPKARALLPLFKSEICDQAQAIDPDEEMDWHAMSIGWAMAKGLSINEAGWFAGYVRYTLHYWR